MRCAIARNAATSPSARRRSRRARLNGPVSGASFTVLVSSAVSMTDLNSGPSASHLAGLRARAAAPDAAAGECLAFGQALLQHAGRDKANQREALAALVRAYQLDPSCEPTLLHTIAQTAFVVRDWVLVDSAATLLLERNREDANALIWRAAAVQQRD